MAGRKMDEFYVRKLIAGDSGDAEWTIMKNQMALHGILDVLMSMT
jgi:hypothetical protein